VSWYFPRNLLKVSLVVEIKDLSLYSFELLLVVPCIDGTRPHDDINPKLGEHEHFLLQGQLQLVGPVLNGGVLQLLDEGWGRELLPLDLTSVNINYVLPLV
jgi:hypothetical protein